MVKLIILLTTPGNDDFGPLDYIDCKRHDTPRDSPSGKYVNKIPRFGSGKSEECIIFMDLVQKSFVGQNVTTDPPMLK